MVRKGGPHRPCGSREEETVRVVNRLLVQRPVSTHYTSRSILSVHADCLHGGRSCSCSSFALPVAVRQVASAGSCVCCMHMNRLASRY